MAGKRQRKTVDPATRQSTRSRKPTAKLTERGKDSSRVGKELQKKRGGKVNPVIAGRRGSTCSRTKSTTRVVKIPPKSCRVVQDTDSQNEQTDSDNDHFKRSARKRRLTVARPQKSTVDRSPVSTDDASSSEDDYVEQVSSNHETDNRRLPGDQLAGLLKKRRTLSSPADVEDMVSQNVLSDVLGADNDFAHPGQFPNRTIPLMSNTPLGSAVQIKIKEKIWNNEYIHLGQLLNTTPRQDEYTLGIKSNKEGESLVGIQPAARIRPLPNIDQWTSAFHIFAALVLQQTPSQGPSLLKYMEIVRDLAKQGGWGWRLYDETFRQQREENHYLDWGVLHGELWLRAMALAMTGNGTGPFRDTQPSFGNFRGFNGKQPCMFFNKRGFCQKRGCQYDHVCSQCKGNHAASNCYSRKQSNPYYFNRQQYPTPSTSNFNKQTTSSHPQYQGNTGAGRGFPPRGGPRGRGWSFSYPSTR